MIDRKECLVFYHIPKTAGTTFADILNNEYGKQHSFHLSGPTKFTDMDRYRGLNKEAKERINVITGHLSHLLQPDIPLKIRYVTFLRDPIDQFISSYNYILQTPHNPHHEAVKKLKNMEEYLDWQVKKEHDSLYARYLGDAVKYHARVLNHHVDAQDPKEGDALLKRASKRLADIEFVFLTEEFDEAILTLKKALGWPHIPFYTRLNTSKRSTLPNQKLIDSVKKIHKYDFILYDKAAKRHRQLVNLYLGGGANIKAKLFQFTNRYHSNLINTLHKTIGK